MSTKNRNAQGQFVKGHTVGIKHGGAKRGNKSRLYRIWNNIRSRCKNPKNPNYKYYGARGISICEEWEGFENFRDWAKGNEYKEGLEIDRIDNDGDYCPENCHWVTRSEQMNNTRQNHILTYKGKSLTTVQWARKLGINPDTLRGRIFDGWSDKEILETPVEEVENE